MPVGVSRQRLAANPSLDRFEQEQSAFFERVRRGYFDRANADPARFRIVDGNEPIEIVRAQLAAILDLL